MDNKISRRRAITGIGTAIAAAAVLPVLGATTKENIVMDVKS